MQMNTGNRSNTGKSLDSLGYCSSQDPYGVKAYQNEIMNFFHIGEELRCL